MLFGRTPYNWVHVPLTRGETITAQQFTELQQVLSDTYVAAGRTAPVFVNTAAPGQVIGKAATEELRILVMDLAP